MRQKVNYPRIQKYNIWNITQIITYVEKKSRKEILKCIPAE